ncbi:hypothetical protein ACFLU5_17475, partial [Bacteroidota bacterium]
ITQDLAADTLSPGFHSLGMRVKDVNGTWSIPEYRSFIISSTGSVIVSNIDTIEYFFDDDPGVGNAVGISVASSDSINLDLALAADTLSPGFHILGMRVKDENENWSVPEYRLFVVSQTNSLTVSPIVRIEYFYDDDPGLGSGNLVFSGSQDSVQLNFNIPPPLVAGLHTVTIRAQDADGNWGIPEIHQVYSLDPGRELDSLALVLMFNNTNGPAWSSATNWLSGDLDTWQGVATAATRVDSVNLDANGLAGELPIEFAYITSMRSFTLSNNALRDSVPYNIPTLMTGLEYVDISNNQLNGLPNLSTISGFQTLKAANNNFDFGDLEPNASVPDFTYNPQNPVTQPVDTFMKPNDIASLDVVMGGTNNNYQWYKDSVLISGATANSYFMTPVTPTDSGLYFCLIDNDLLPDLTLTTDFFHVLFSSRTTDSLALVLLYNNTDGANWTNRTNWLTGVMDTWAGLTLDSINVRQVRLPSNNLVGTIPEDIYYLDSLNLMDLSGNTISGHLPGTILDMVLLDTLNLQNNQLDSLPNLVVAPLLNNVNVIGNKLHFGDFEINLGISNFQYIPQDSLGTYEYLLAEAWDPFSMNAKVRGFNNTYQWFKSGAAIAGQTNEDLSIASVEYSDEGFYRAEVNNSLVTGLTLYTASRELRVSSLERDSVALVKLYNTTAGDNWTDNTGWDSTARGDLSTWVGVVVTDNRISGVNLPGNNLDGEVTARIRDITKIEVFDVSGNKLRKIPYMGTLLELTNLDVSMNQLGFEYLEPNLAIAAFVYDPQDSLDVNTPDTIYVSDPYSFTAGSYSDNNSYQWLFNDANITGETDSTYKISTMERDSMGFYSVEMTNSAIPGMEIYSKPVRLMAKASIAGNITAAGSAVTAGEIRLFQISPSGGFDTTNVASISNDGTYLIEDVLLDDYVLVADGDDANYADWVPTYYGNTIYWEEADTIPLTDDITQIDIPFFEEPVDPAGLGSIAGTVEEDLEAGGRIVARRKVKKATVTIKKVAGTQRKTETQEDEVVAVAYTDDNGQFLMPKLEAGTYDLNVQYPGIPMDETTDTRIIIG